ncbi:CDP-glycerol glycerophosphotransferase family protein [Marmoricola sp. Leaf446]|uniref:CDP-glycerol glycerophosphotransferase family protein n=1 Tax=Marmoricola sp. Leaf446 TaxID=1736379 RepID=UPI001F15FC33|nr:CDP-glycerol glycerophosphotransferase family protein [Marmoricola sp. Leaf446]
MVIPKNDRIVIRTFPDFDDQGLELAQVLRQRGHRVTWLIRDAASIEAAGRAVVDQPVAAGRSIAGVWAYLRAPVVLHTHGFYGSPRSSRRKTSINLWHGMPVKRLNSKPLVARHQTDVLTVTSGLHARNIENEWKLSSGVCVVSGLPRNDLLRPMSLSRDQNNPPMIVWMPTYRNSVFGEIRRDGREFKNVFQLPGASMQDINARAADAGVRVVLKLHPMAPEPECIPNWSNLQVLNDVDLRRQGTTTYRLLARSDLLITDHSSVWIDYLLTGRPMIFSIADLDEYSDTRGHYFPDLPAVLPGPIVRDMSALFAAVKSALAGSGEDAWRVRREEARSLHHHHEVRTSSSQRVARIVERQLRSRSLLT